MNKIRLPRTAVRLMALVLVLLLCAPLAQPARATGLPVVDAANLTQNLATRIQTWTAILQRITQILNQIQQIQNQIESLKNEYQNLVQLGEDFRVVQAEIRELIRAYHDLLQEGRALVYTARDLKRRFKEVFNPYPVTGLTWREQQLLRSEISLDTYLGILLANQQFGRDAERTAATNRELTAQALGTEGNLEALHAQALIEAHTAQQVALTVQQLATLNNLLAVHFANEIATQESVERSFDEWLAQASEAPPYESFPGLKPLPQFNRP